ncbi:FkbM family methyltransferase [Spirosoma sp. BT702]|uniref:FkbM family methyltransferase n=1 Tax=Spirosoma profusum TaxID=2771354 RepID=A0A927AQK9_9BACT|nr:FkbM family methyltransferase [Spirosoma profusum]MBD2700691.1 FkbM family methyltransferase [Spirosoma profusum]
MIRSLLKNIIKKTGGYISSLLVYKKFYQLYNFIYERSPYFFTHLAGKYIALPDRNNEWKILLENGKQLNTSILAGNAKTRQFAVSYQWHSPELNFTEYLLNQYFDKRVPWIDVGANLGMRSLLSLSEGRPVFFIEPNKELNVLNRERCELNNFLNYTFFEVGASDREGYSSFYIDNSSYNSTLTTNLLQNEEILKEETIEIATIDSLFLNLLEHAETACIKVDVEGHELQVLEGAKLFIKSFSPTMIIEVNDSSNHFQEFRKIVKSYDYELFAIVSRKAGKYFEKIHHNQQIKAYPYSNDFLTTKDIGLIKQIEKYTL